MYSVKLSLSIKGQESQNLTLKMKTDEEFETEYFRCLKNSSGLVYGYIDNKLEFVIENGTEVCDHRAKVLSIDPQNWEPPSVAQFNGAVAQFEKIRNFCEAIGVTRAAVSNWRNGRKIDFYRWSHILTYLDINRTFTENKKKYLL